MLEAEEQTEDLRLASMIQWLEGEQKQDKNLLNQLQNILTQLSLTSREQAEKAKSLENSLAALSSQIQRLPRLEEELNQLREAARRNQVDQAGLVERIDQAERARQVEVERERQARVDLWGRLDALSRDTEALQGKQAILGELERRHQDLSAQMKEQLEGLRNQVSNLEGKLIRTDEVNRRGERETQRLSQEVESLAKQDELALGRLQVLSEHLHQMDERQASFISGDAVRQEMGRGLEILRAEQQRLLKTFAELEAHLQEQLSRWGDQEQRLAQADAKSHAILERMDSLQMDFEDYRQGVTHLLASYIETEEQLKRRQAIELEQEVQELRRRAIQLKGG